LDEDCWKDWFASKLQCDDGDSQCWSDANAKFTCSLSDPFCWNDKVTQFPCASDETDCLSGLLPNNAPCKFG